MPSITELLIDLGLANYVVGRTGFCIHPADQVARIPKTGGTKDVNIGKIRALRPTHVIVNVDENDKPTVDTLRAYIPYIVVTHPLTPEDNLALIDQLFDAFFELLKNSISAIDNIAACALSISSKALKSEISQRLRTLQTHHPRVQPERVLYLIWKDPWISVARDTYISRMLHLVDWQTLPDLQGGNGISAPGAARYPVLLGNEVWLRDVDRVLLPSEPYRFSLAHIAQVQQWLPHAKVQLVDGEMLSWYGSRAVAGLDYLAALAGWVTSADASTKATSS